MPTSMEVISKVASFFGAKTEEEIFSFLDKGFDALSQEQKVAVAELLTLGEAVPLEELDFSTLEKLLSKSSNESLSRRAPGRIIRRGRNPRISRLNKSSSRRKGRVERGIAEPVLIAAYKKGD
jgi:hypothetical protein